MSQRFRFNLDKAALGRVGVRGAGARELTRATAERLAQRARGRASDSSQVRVYHSGGNVRARATIVLVNPRGGLREESVDRPLRQALIEEAGG